MPIVDHDRLFREFAAGRRVLGLDVGKKTVGIAASDPDHAVASPVTTIRRTKFAADAAALEALIDARAAAGLVIGLPVNMDGSEGPRCQSVRQFAANLDAYFGAPRSMPMVFWDERLSTAAVTRTLLEADVSRQRRGQVVDKLAAAFILQGALDAWAARRTAEPG